MQGGVLFRLQTLDGLIKYKSPGAHAWKNHIKCRTPEELREKWGDLKSTAMKKAPQGEPPPEATVVDEADITVLPPVPSTNEGALAAPPAHAPDAVTAQYRRAVSGVLELLRFGVMLLEVEGSIQRSLSRQTTSKPWQFAGREGGLKEWLIANCPEVNYNFAVKHKLLADAMRRNFDLPGGVPLSLALPPPASLDGLEPPLAIPEGVKREDVEAARKDVAAFLDGKSARQLEFDFGIRKVPPKCDPPSGDKKDGLFTAAHEAQAARDLWNNLAAKVTLEGVTHRSWALLPAEEMECVASALRTASDLISKHLKKQAEKGKDK
jgi:hypothetical protein